MPHTIKIYGVRHNTFRFTIKFNVSEGVSRELLGEYIQSCCANMPQVCCEPTEILATFFRQNEYIVYLKMEVKDYGVAQIGIDIIASWIEVMYRHCVSFTIDTMVVHPKANPPANGAIITWDYENARPIIKVIPE